MAAWTCGWRIEGNRISVERHTYSTWEDSSKVVNQILGDVSASLRDVPAAAVVELSAAVRGCVLVAWRRQSRCAATIAGRREVSPGMGCLAQIMSGTLIRGGMPLAKTCPKGPKCIERVALHAVTGKIEDRNRYCVVITTGVRWLLSPRGGELRQMVDAKNAGPRRARRCIGGTGLRMCSMTCPFGQTKRLAPS